MLIKLNDEYFVDPRLVTAVRFFPNKTVVVCFYDNGSEQFSGTREDMERIVTSVNADRVKD